MYLASAWYLRLGWLRHTHVATIGPAAEADVPSTWSPLRRFLYFLCGGVVGFWLTMGFVWRICVSFGWPTWVMVSLMVASALTFGIFSARLGDSFLFWRGGRRWRWLGGDRRLR